MAWITLTETDLKTRISGAELAAFRAAALATGQADPIADIISQTVEMVRGYVAGCLRNVLGPTGTIPSKLKKPALALIVLDVMSRAAGKVIQDANGERQKEADKAVELLRDVAACHFAIDVPDEVSDEVIAQGTPSFHSCRIRKFRDQTGI